LFEGEIGKNINNLENEDFTNALLGYSNPNIPKSLILGDLLDRSLDRIEYMDTESLTTLLHSFAMTRTGSKEIISLIRKTLVEAGRNSNEEEIEFLLLKILSSFNMIGAEQVDYEPFLRHISSAIPSLDHGSLKVLH
jgi:endonuclease III-like uncharacterized protein